MSNTYSIFEDWKKTLGSYYNQAETGLLGRKDIVAGKDMGTRSGGVLGGDGMYDRSIDYAGKKFDEVKNTTVDQVKDYALGEDKLVSSPSIGQTERPGFKGSQMDQDINKGIDTGIKYFDKGINKSKDFIEKHTGNAWNAMFPDETNSGSISEADKQKILNGDKTLYDQKTSPLGEKDVGTLEKIMGIDLDTAKTNWKDKGGFEGLMSNPAFTLGLALMQSSANGKTINQGLLDNFIVSAKISSEFKDRIKARGSIIGPASAEEIGQVEAFLGSKKIGKSGFFDKVKDIFTGSTNQEDYRRMLSDIAQYNNKRANELEAKGKKVVKDESFMEQSILEMKSKGLLKTKTKGSTKGLFSNFNFNQTKIQGNTNNVGLGFNREHGGPVTAGKPYVVGEAGPEIIIPTSDGNVLSNDDSQIYAMLLASNPQLQKVSRQRAEKILRNRFPEYFEG
jgi:hypothetical protein